MKDKILELKIKMIELLIAQNEIDYGCTVKSFMKLGGEKKDIKEILKDLKISEMIESNWCVDDDGMLSGRAYFLTTRATQWSIREWLQELKKIRKLLEKLIPPVKEEI